MERKRAKQATFKKTTIPSAVTGDLWEIVWDKDGREWPSKCPACGSQLEVQIGGTITRTYELKDDGRTGEMADEDVDFFWSNPIFMCTQDNCDFQYGVED